MPWPFGSEGSLGSSSSDKSRTDDDRPSQKSTSWNDLLPKTQEPLETALTWVPVLLAAMGSVGSYILYQNYLKRFPNAANVQDNFFRRRSLLGRVTSVGDGDGFHLYHTPGGKLAGWGWLRKIPDARADLKGNTISIRLAGVDAPEGPHFGRPGQPYAAEALTFLSDYIRHRSVRARIYKRDQYNRIVATVHVRRFLFQKDVGLELLKQGLATTYEAKSGIEWGGKKEIYEAAQAKAKAKKMGMWSAKSSDFVSPRAYKAKLHEAEKESDAKVVQEKKSWWRRWLS